LIRESIERDMREIPRIALSLTDSGKRLLNKIERQHPASILAI